MQEEGSARGRVVTCMRCGKRGQGFGWKVVREVATGDTLVVLCRPCFDAVAPTFGRWLREQGIEL